MTRAKRERERPRERAAYWAYRAVERLAMSLPERPGRRVFEWIGGLAHRTLHGVRATVTANQARVLGVDEDDPLARRAAREAFRMYARYWFDTFHVRVLSPAEVNRRTRFEGIENIDRALEAGGGCIAILPHMGNWDVAGRWLGLNGYRLAAVAEALKPKRLADLFLRHREALGVRILPLEAGSAVGQQLATLLAGNWIVALVADRDLSGRGVEVEMFGAPRRLPAGPAVLSLTTGAPILVCPMWDAGDGWVVRVGAPIEVERTGAMREDVTALTRRIALEFERAIAARPADWHMFQPAWGEPERSASRNRTAP